MAEIWKMTDEAFAEYLGINDDVRWPAVVASFPDSRRRTIERMSEIEHEFNLWQAGLGSKPQGVLIDMDNKRGRKRYG